MKKSKKEKEALASEKELDNIFYRYKRGLGGRIAVITTNWRLIRQAIEWSDELHNLLSQTVDEAHKLSGSAGIFGYEAISDLAAPLEYILHHINEEQTVASKQRVAQIDLLMSELATSLDKEAPVHFAKAILGGVRPVSKTDKEVLLLTGDNKSGRELSNVIEHFDYRVKSFNDVDETIKTIKAQKPSAILVDLTEFHPSSSALRLVEDYQLEIPFILLVNEDDFDTRLMVAQVGGRGFMIKPIDEDELISWLDRMTGTVQQAPYEVLIIDNDQAIAQSYAVTLTKAGMRADVLDDPRHILDVLSANKPDVILLDVFMSKFSGIDLAKVIRQQSHFLSIPIMFLTDDPDLTRRYQAMIYGADDILQKPISPTQLTLAVVNRAARARSLRSVMERDSLTGLFNHAMLKERLNQEIDRAERIGRPVTFALIDIDFFKKVNDRYGHVAGDMVLRNMSKFLMKRLRKTDIIGRYGGEEFAVILTDSNIDIAEKVMNELRDNFAKIEHYSGVDKFNVTFSCGLCSFEPNKTASEMIEKADERLYTAKKRGRNCVVKD